MRLIDYLKYKKLTIAAFIVFAVFIFACLLLSDVPLSTICYPMILCALAGVVFLIIGYRRHMQTVEALHMIAGLKAELIDALPQPLTPEAERYQRIIRSLCAEEVQRQTEANQKYIDMIDYYTAWAHQIKTPIAAMKLSFQNEDSSLARQSLNDLRRVEQYVDMVMTYLKLESEGIDYVISEHELDEIIRPVIRNFAGEFIGRQIRLEYEPIHFTVLTDDKWIAFVIEQVISNALKYTREGTVRIYLEETCLCISDTGIGVAKEDIPRIFEKGFTGYNGREDRRATGIGLYLCKRICGNLSLAISAESEVGVGTTIRIDLQRKPVGIE